MTMSVAISGPLIDSSQPGELICVADIRVHNGDNGDFKSLFIKTDKPKMALDQAVSELKLMHDRL